MTTLAQYRTAVASKVGLDNSTNGDQAFIDSWVNEGVTDVLLRTKCRMRCANLTLTAGTATYTLDTSILQVYDAWVVSGGNSYWLEQVTVDDLRQMQRTTTASVSPAQYYAVGGSDYLLIYPTPQTTGDTFSIDYLPRPAVLSISSDTPSEIPTEFQKAVEFYALREAADFSQDSASQDGLSYQALYEQWIKRIKKWVALKGGHRMPLAHVRRNPMTFPYHDRSRYP